jgi:hypothetical protein
MPKMPSSCIFLYEIKLYTLDPTGRVPEEETDLAAIAEEVPC